MELSSEKNIGFITIIRQKEYRIYNYKIRIYYKLNILLDGMK